MENWLEWLEGTSQKVFWEIDASKMFRILRDNYKSEENPLKIIVNEHIFGKVTGLQPAALPKNEIHYSFLN